MTTYHTGYLEIREPDVYYGRKNADFGQGFYMTDDRSFACRWAKEKKGTETILNTYGLDTEGLVIRRFSRDEAWFEYILHNRTGKTDLYPEADVIIGPIANDTIYDTFGMITSGLLPQELAMQLLLIGPEYYQIVLKTEKAARHLHWLLAERLGSEELIRYREIVAAEERAYQEQIAAVMEKV